MVPPGTIRDIQRSRGSKRASVGSPTSKPHWMGQRIQKAAGNHLAQWFLFWFVLTSMTVLPVIAPRDSAPNRDDNYHVLHGVAEWNGVPRRDFRRIWFAALIVALGAIFQDGWTLLQTARDQDAGGPSNPGVGANAATAQRQSENRNHRLFMSILKYIDKLSSIYKLATTHFNHDGRGLFNYLWTYGHKAYTTKQNQKRENVWKDASVASLRIPVSEDTPQLWKEWCVEHGERLGKTLSDIRIKYLEGFPASFDVVIMPERSSLANARQGNYVLPANYPAHYPAHLAGNAHPQAGQPDLDTLAEFLSAIWVDMMLQDKIKAPPAGSAHQVTEDVPINTGNSSKLSCDHHSISQIGITSDSQSGGLGIESAFGGLFGAFQIAPVLDPASGTIHNQVFAVKRDSIGPQTLCYVCGGRGHVSRIDGITCATLELGVQVPRPLLETTTYSDGISFPKFQPKRSGSTSSPRSQNRAVVRIGPPRRGSPTGTRKSPIKEVKTTPAADAADDNSTDSEDSKYNAHQVEIAMDFGGIQV